MPAGSPIASSATSITGGGASPCGSGGESRSRRPAIAARLAGVLIRKVDGATDEEWRAFVTTGPRFGELIASGAGPAGGRPVPVVVPTHFFFDGDSTVSLHLARP